MLAIFKHLLRPAKIFEAPELRRRILVLNSLILAYTLCVAVMFIVSFFLDFKGGGDQYETQFILGVCLVIFFIASALGRTRHYVLGGILFNFTIYAGCTIAPLPLHSVKTAIGVMPYLIIPALIGAFLLPLRVAVLNFAVGIGISLGLAFYFNLHLGTSQEAFLVFFNLIAYAILFIGTMLRAWDEKQMINDRMQLVKNSKMETLGQMAGNIAHEMNTPIGAIKLRAAQIARLLRQEEEKDEQKGRLIAMASDIEKIAQEVALTVDGLQRFSRSDEKSESQPIRIAQALENTLRICRQKIEHGGVQLHIAEFDRDLEVLGSEVQISQVLLNLLMNALQAAAHLPERWIQVSVEEVQERVEISVMDSGLGIPSRLTSKIFDPFFSTKPTGEGTGLGLSISQSIIERLNGKLFLDTECRNTRFVVSLPRLGLKESES